MKRISSRKQEQAESWPYPVKYGNVTVSVYKRSTPSGNDNFMVPDYSSGLRKFISFKVKSEALAKADELARKKAGLAEQVQKITTGQAIEYFNSVARLRPLNVTVDSATACYAQSAERLKPFKVSVDAATACVADCLALVPDLAALREAAKFYKQRHRQVTKKTVAELVKEFITLKESRGASARYRKDLKSRLGRFANDCQKSADNVSTSDVQDWLDGLKLSQQSYRNFRTVLNTLFEFGVKRGFCLDNPVEDVENIKVNGGKVEIFTPKEIADLLAAAPADFKPFVVLSAFAGLRSAEVERIEWRDIDLTGGFIHVSADNAKTRSRRLVPIQPNLKAWLADYANCKGKVWNGSANGLKFARAETVKKSGVKWKDNGLRHSYISYRLADVQDAAKVALEAGNSPNVVFKHYRELVKPDAAKAWFSIAPKQPENVVYFPKADAQAAVSP
jgi:integrase